MNKLEFYLRFREVFIAGLYFAKEQPLASLFLKAFVEAFNRIGTLVSKCEGINVKSMFFVTCFCVDSPARASMLNMMKYNAYYGCQWWLEEGTPVDRTIRGIPSRQPAPLRTHRSMVQDMQQAFISQERDCLSFFGSVTDALQLKP
ncbi:hypothetical protein HPB48_002548 [Haemaphysalis longicornis]|uniref:Uncharacterized protein n=1 Tax=Haemaphysalis longicornis TaxID=44386 RepID=A0A9J6GJT2_HAELO|nr:hypothetical protein HPB48_002548 [Haemaphysalis longicornis]